jgi:hypothetical protein
LTLRYVRPAPAIGSNYYSTFTFNLTVSCSCEAYVCRIGDADVEEFDAGVTELAKSLSARRNRLLYYPVPPKKMTIGELKYFELKSTYEKIDLPDL